MSQRPVRLHSGSWEDNKKREELHTKKFLEEFKAFALRGNVMDMVIGAKKEEEAAPTTKVCPFCKSEIDIEATRCPHCTSVLNETEEK